jgi:hypothetical protein
MFTTKILYLLLLVPNNLQNYLSRDSDSIYIRFKGSNGGNDERYYTTNNISIDTGDTTFILDKIRRHIIIKNIIEELEKNTTNINNKLHIIEKYTDIYQKQNKVSGFNLLGGNLLNDFYDMM